MVRTPFSCKDHAKPGRQSVTLDELLVCPTLILSKCMRGGGGLYRCYCVWNVGHVFKQVLARLCLFTVPHLNVSHSTTSHSPHTPHTHPTHALLTHTPHIPLSSHILRTHPTHLTHPTHSTLLDHTLPPTHSTLLTHSTILTHTPTHSQTVCANQGA